MKRISVIILSILLLLSLASCDVVAGEVVDAESIPMVSYWYEIENVTVAPIE